MSMSFHNLIEKQIRKEMMRSFHHEPSPSNLKKHYKDIFFHLLDQAYGKIIQDIGDQGTDGPITTGIFGWDALEAYGPMDFGDDEV